MIILGLDLANHTGVAVGDASRAPVCSTEILGEPGTDHGRRFAQCMRVTKRLIERCGVQVVAIEQPIASGVKGSQERVQLAMGYRAAVFMAATVTGVLFVEYPVQTIRKSFIGDGSLKRDAAKVRVFNQCARFGWRVANHDESDACAVWQTAALAVVGLDRPVEGSLFGTVTHNVRKRAS